MKHRCVRQILQTAIKLLIRLFSISVYSGMILNRSQSLLQFCMRRVSGICLKEKPLDLYCECMCVW